MRIFYFLVLQVFISFSCTSENPYQISEVEQNHFEFSKQNAVLANEGFIRCENFAHAWLAYADPGSGLIPRNIDKDKDFWNAKDAAADNYPFMVLTSFFC